MRKGGLSIDDLGFGMASANKQNHEDREIAERMERGRRFLNTPPQPHGKNPNHNRLQSPKSAPHRKGAFTRARRGANGRSLNGDANSRQHDNERKKIINSRARVAIKY